MYDGARDGGLPAESSLMRSERLLLWIVIIHLLGYRLTKGEKTGLVPEGEKGWLDVVVAAVRWLVM